MCNFNDDIFPDNLWALTFEKSTVMNLSTSDYLTDTLSVKPDTPQYSATNVAKSSLRLTVKQC